MALLVRTYKTMRSKDNGIIFVAKRAKNVAGKRFADMPMNHHPKCGRILVT
ncbi:MAG: hypothetical protein AAGA86_10220 [Bacteroidota bacterium]